MLAVSTLTRRFLFRDGQQDIELADPSDTFSPEAVLNFYAQTYAALTTAKIEGPEIVNDHIQYKFILTIGTKG